MILPSRTTAIPISSADLFPANPGVYAVFSNTRLPGLSWEPARSPVYVGKADDGLRRRIGREHGGDTGRSTLRRSLAALLREELRLVIRCRPTRGTPKRIDFTNFALDPEGELTLSDWLADHLTVAAAEPTNRWAAEVALVRELQPPLNLLHWENPWRRELKWARKQCADEARQRFVV